MVVKKNSSRLLRFVAIATGVFLLTQAEVQAAPYSALVVDVDSERVLYSQSPDELRHPASLTKMMTLYMVFEALSSGELTLDSMVMASSHATSRPPSSLGLRTGESLTVEQAILAVVTQSANDAATTLAEHLGRGSEAEFAEMMTQKARQLGMTGSSFYNASGLPHPDQWTTARDMYRLGRALQKNFPQYYPYFSTQSFEFRGRDYHNHNHLLETYQGTDGIKTGFINASGFNLVASAKRNNMRLVGVVFGGPSHARRDAHMREILEDGFAQLEGREPSVHLASFDAPAIAKPLMLASAGSVNELSSARPPRHHAAKPVKAPPHKEAAKPAHTRDAPANRHAHAPAKSAAHTHEAHNSGKPAKSSAAASHHAAAKQTPAHAAPAHDKHHGKSSSGH